MDHLWIDFVNSDARDYLGQGRHEDRLEDHAWWSDFRTRGGLPPVDLDRAARDRSRRLRALLRRIVTRLVERGHIADEDVEQLNGFLTARPIVGRLERDDDAFRIRSVSARADLDSALAIISASFARFLADDDPTRLKTCDNPDCGWVFYDTTRSRTRRWCADVCGNLMKVRRYRARKKG